MIDLYLVYQFIKRLSTPFEDWSTYKTGVIDKRGNILIKKEDRNSEQNKSFSKFDLLILKLKLLLSKLPYGSSKLASYIAALWLIKENYNEETNNLNEEYENIEEMFLEFYSFYITEVLNLQEDAVTVGSGAIAGLGVGDQGEPGLTRTQQKKHTKRAASTFRKPFSDTLDEAETVEDELADDSETPKSRSRYYRIKKHIKPSERLT